MRAMTGELTFSAHLRVSKRAPVFQKRCLDVVKDATFRLRLYG
jgi:hypothetical protein